MKLKKAQREAVLAWIAEGLESDEINARAAKFKPKFKVTRQQVDHYRKSRKVDIKEIQSSGEFGALTSGLAVRENRVKLLSELADLLKDDIFRLEKLWLENAKSVGMERFNYLEFNASEVAQLRGVLDDIAQEVGERGKTLEHKGSVGLFDIESWKVERKKRMETVEALEDVDA
jgi:hypothetical protein